MQWRQINRLSTGGLITIKQREHYEEGVMKKRKLHEETKHRAQLFRSDPKSTCVSGGTMKFPRRQFLQRALPRSWPSCLSPGRKQRRCM
jgi:hypothetical protein